MRIAERIRQPVLPRTLIPKPEAKDDVVVTDWGNRRGEDALMYLIPNRSPELPRLLSAQWHSRRRASVPLATGRFFMARGFWRVDSW